jgi:hypothetical protein
MPLTLTNITPPLSFPIIDVNQICLITATGELKESEQTIAFPIPTTGTFHVQSAMRVSLAEVIDVNGKIVQSIQPESSAFTIDLAGLSQGIYMLRLTGTAGISRHKIILQ